MVALVRQGHSQRAVARQFGVQLRTVQRWLQRARGRRLDRVDWSDAPDGCHQPPQRTSRTLEDRVLRLRRALKETSALGEYGAAAIHRELSQRSPKKPGKKIPSLRTIGRILVRRGALDGQRRVRRPPPPRGWFLPDVAAGRAELDSFDIVQDLVIEGGTFVHVLNGVSLHGGLCASWPRTRITAKNTVQSLLQHWRQFGVPAYAKFDNDTVFQGTHRFADSFGRVTRLCLSLGVTPVFAPPGETGFQADIENYNGRWQSKVWRRFHFTSPADVMAQSDRFVAACRRRSAPRIQDAPTRRPLPTAWHLDLQAPLRGLVIFLRRTDEAGQVTLLGRRYRASRVWPHRLVRVEVDLTRGKLRCYALRRREPSAQPLLATHTYRPPQKTFHE